MPPDDDGRGRDAFAVEFPGDLRIPVAEVSDEQPETGDCGGCDPEGFFVERFIVREWVSALPDQVIVHVEIEYPEPAVALPVERSG